MGKAFECAINLEKDVKGIRIKNRQSLFLRRWREGKVQQFKKDKSMDPDKYYVMSISLSDRVENYCEEVWELNDLRCRPFVNIRRLIDDFDGKIIVVRGNDWYWSGILSAYLWEDLKIEEDTIVEKILRYHIFRDENYNLFFDFNEESSLNDWLRKYWNDGDVAINCSTIFARTASRMITMLKDDDSNYPRYQKIVWEGYCKKCDTPSISEKEVCLECGGQLEYES
ncbi:MAG: hypothetical protein V1799_07540 [bacterium]